MAMDTREALEARRADIKRLLGEIDYMRAGSLVANYRRCGKAGCWCSKPGEKGHGPYWLLTRGIGGKTRSRSIPAGAAVEQTRLQIAEWRRFQALCRELVEVDERLCDQRQRANDKVSAAEAKKGASKSPSKQKSRQKSSD
jgi:hypothetical protein